MTEQVDKT